MSILFDVIYLLLSILYLPSLLFKGKRRIGLRERFGIYAQEKKQAFKEHDDFIWVHAVSVGEIKAAAPLIEQLRIAFPGSRLVISTITSTGNIVAKQIALATDIVIYFPFDLSFIVKKILSLINPKMIIILETELWPNLIRIAAARKMSLIIANGRISDKAYPSYKRFSFVFSRIIRKINLLCMQSSKDAQRIISLGADEKNVKIVGNIKFDQVVTSDAEVLPDLKTSTDELLIIAGSTHDKEEELLVRVYIALKQKHKNIRLLIAPRHPHRVIDVQKVLEKHSLKGKLISSLIKAHSKAMPDDIFILDIMGVLAQAYKSADIVFIGGSMVKRGGQNPIEPALCLKPIVFGKYMYNFHAVEKMFLSANAALSVDNEEALRQSLDGLIRDKGKREVLAANAKALVLKNQGAAKRTISLLVESGTRR